ncbi:MAG: cytochrome c biogenesis protein CcsA, partial [Candidatus Omnitrophica bacterium]|nr:cytochrome c biogenesis protein CcsA [Candidatus Omnitrophota bacterium]
IPSIDKVVALVQHSQAKRDKDIRPTKLEQKAEELYSQLMTLQRLEEGESITTVPSVDENAPWQSPLMTADSVQRTAFSKDFETLLQLYSQGNFQGFNQAVGQWQEKVSAVVSPATRMRISLEKYYYDIQPFEWSWILYLLAFVLLAFFASTPPHPAPLPLRGRGLGEGVIRFMGTLSISLAILFHTAGIVLRVIILARPPVSNMYESMIYMNWILMVFAVIFAVARKTSLPLSVGSLISALVMLYAHLLPLDSSMDVLVPVLRSNYWLTIHVMTIVSSYGAFGLAMALGHRHLFLSARRKFTPQTETDSAQLIYRVMQLGIFLVGVGTVLGGVWANESWGRFWGWDPKETWALITFLGYLVIVLARHAKWLDNFGLAVGSVLGFLLVLMTWYGVNFVLGRGLHSYGFGSGGIVWIIYYLVFEALFLGWAIFSKLKTVRKNDF